MNLLEKVLNCTSLRIWNDSDYKKAKGLGVNQQIMTVEQETRERQLSERELMERVRIERTQRERERREREMRERERY